ncbi:TonB-dependent receptor plug domain-containing protein, partial [Priestia megaterium]|uniref:TonB-dependent receptor plug domain-containing protein n=1 Tax=Priestia megaterium TaxID=1404 RepID=UPI0035B611D2
QLPGITVNTADKSLSIVAIRGNVSTFRTATLDTPVAFFVDDVYYVFNNDVNSNFYDLSRVEVLRGPQGTLFGRNVVGGALAIVTNNP